MNIDWSLLLLVVIGVVFVIGLILLLQSARGRTGLANAALRLAEALIAYAVRWLEGRGASEANVAVGMAMDDRAVRAKTALAILRG